MEVNEKNGQAEQQNMQQNKEEMDAVKLLMELLGQQGMREPSQDFMEVLQYIAGMQIQLAAMVDELQGVREQLGKMQESQPEHKNEVLSKKVSHLQEKVTSLVGNFAEAKDRLIHTAVQAVSAFQEKGREEMNKVLQKGIFGVKAMLLGHRERLLDTLTSYEQTANQIDSIGDELKQIANSTANVGRLLAGKGTKEVSEEKPGVALTRVINQPVKQHIAKLKKQMDGMDRAIQKLDNLSSSLSSKEMGKGVNLPETQADTEQKAEIPGKTDTSKGADVPVKADTEKDAEISTKGTDKEKGTRVSVKEKLSEMKAKSEQQKKAPEKPKEKSKEACL